MQLLHHLVVKLMRCCGRLDEPVEIADVLPSLLEDAKMVFVPWPLVPRDHSPRLQRLNFIERGNPFTPLLRIGFGQQLMNAAVCSVSSHHQSYGRRMQDGRVVRIGVPDFDGNQIPPFELDHISFHLLGNHHSLGNLPWKPRAPPRFQYLRRLFPHHVDHSPRWILGEGHEPLLILDRRSGRRISRVRILDSEGHPLAGRDMAVVPGPGASKKDADPLQHNLKLPGVSDRYCIPGSDRVLITGLRTAGRLIPSPL
jgi:hypothetical protein